MGETAEGVETKCPSSKGEVADDGEISSSLLLFFTIPAENEGALALLKNLSPDKLDPPKLAASATSTLRPWSCC